MPNVLSGLEPDPFWCWLCAGVLLMTAELATPGFVIMFFGLSAATVALLCGALGDSFTFTWQLAAFAVLSVAYVLTLRRFAKKIFAGEILHAEGGEAETDANFAGRNVEVLSPVGREIPGRVALGDAEWSAVSADGREIAPGDAAVVVRCRNLTLEIRKLP